VDSYDVIVVEGMRIADMIARAKPRPDRDIPGAFLPNGVAKTGLNTSISDASWAQFLSLLAAKAQEAGRRMIDVDLRHSADRC
jgi:putative transposase